MCEKNTESLQTVTVELDMANRNKPVVGMVISPSSGVSIFIYKPIIRSRTDA